MDPLFLDLADVVQIHVDQIDRYGGHGGISDFGLLESALAMPRAAFEGEWLHRDIFEMAAAYAFHISQNHPFVDGNKRTALASALVFLELNGVPLLDPEGSLHEAIIAIASGDLDKFELADALRRLSQIS